MEEMFKKFFGPPLEKYGFEFVGKNRWVRDTGLEFKHLFFLYPFRPGATFYPHGALSFDFVPRIEAGKVRLRPEPKHVRVHLNVAGYGLNHERGIERNKESALEKCQAIAVPVVEAVNRSLRHIGSLVDALAAFQRLRFKSGSGFYAHPESALAYAFTLAKARRSTEAQSELSKALQSRYFESETHAAIRRFFDRVKVSQPQTPENQAPT
jgi:hypothetical protein